jgi:hypothetical protein
MACLQISNSWGMLGLLYASWHLYKTVYRSIGLLRLCKYKKNPCFLVNQRLSQEQFYTITSSCNHSINMRTHRWPYGPCLNAETLGFLHGMKIIAAVQHWHCWMCLVCWVCFMCYMCLMCLICPWTHHCPARPCLDASSQLCLSVRPSVAPLVGPSVRHAQKQVPEEIYKAH